MDRISAEQNIEPSSEIAGVFRVGGAVRAASTLENAAASFVELLSDSGFGLMFHGIFDRESNRLPRYVLSDLPERLAKICEEFEPKAGCPAVQHAIRLGSAFEASSQDFGNGLDFSSKRYIQEIRNLGTHMIAVIPVESVHDVHVFFLCLNGRKFQAHVREQLIEAVHQFVVACMVKFPDQLVPTYVHGVRSVNLGKIPLSSKEMECLDWCARGGTIHEISLSIGLSELTVNHYLKSICAKLGAKNRTHAVSKAISLGLLNAP